MTVLAPTLLSFLTALPLLGFGLIEEFFPYRTSKLSLRRRWTTNFSLLAIDSCLTRWLLPISVIGSATWVHSQGMGLLDQVDWPLAAELPIGFLLWDFSGFVFHRLSHGVPWLWNFHKIHHCDLEVDVTTALRHHPAEALFTTIWETGTVVWLGVDPQWLIFCQTAQLFSAIFNHANMSMPQALDQRLRWVLVTPDMHRVHHSSRHPETDSNFGNLLTCWDRLFASYLDSPRLRQMDLGLNEFRGERQQTLWQQLAIPLRRKRLPVN